MNEQEKDQVVTQLIWRKVRRIADLSNELDTLSIAHVEYVVASWIATGMRRGKTYDTDFLVGATASELLRFYMGTDWFDEVLFHHLGKRHTRTKIPKHRRAAQNFLRFTDKDYDLNLIWQSRVLRLATLLYNLQSFPGMKDRINDLREKDLASTLGELECAQIVATPHSRFRFIAPCGVKGKDYDGEFTTTAGRTASCEFKTKLENTALSSQTIRSTCDKARRQLPKNVPSIIFLKIPEWWRTQESFHAEVEEGTAGVLRQSTRIVSIVFAWEERVRSWEDTYVFYKFHQIPNTGSDQWGPDIVEALQPPLEKWGSNWMDLRSFIETRREDIEQRISRLGLSGRNTGVR